MSDEPTPSKQLLTLTELLERPGWTRAGVTRFLGDPDATKPNPRYRSAAPTRLYGPARVEATEATPEFGSWRAASEARSAKAAQAAAIERLTPGLSFRQAYALAREVFAKEGVAEHFTHSLGHGIGLETHEGPSLNPSAEGLLEPGMVVTVEPGLYYPEWGGARWEHMALITENGCEIL